MRRALIRFGRAVVAAALAGAVTAAIRTVGDLPINDPASMALLTAILLAADKYLRDAGIY